jgi:hypothetical protein
LLCAAEIFGVITFFTTAKPFTGHSGVIQRNALKSWTLVHPDVEVILFGDDGGASEVCAQLGLRHEPHVERNESGVNYLPYMFARAREIACHDYLCYVNCDIVVMEEFAKAFERAKAWKKRFLLVTRRWDMDITAPIDFQMPEWSKQLRQLAATNGFQQDEYWIDLFLFAKDSNLDMPALVVGHCYWDNWMIWKALSVGMPVVDASDFVMVVHQNHGYNPAFGRRKGEATDPLSLRNLQLAGGMTHMRQINSATHVITLDGEIRWSMRRYVIASRRVGKPIGQFLYYKIFLRVWHFVLDVTRPARSFLGFRSRGAR